MVGDALETHALEVALARMKGTEAALVFASGYMASLGVIPALVGPGDLVLLDALSHACLWAGARLSGARVESFAHNDVADLQARLGRSRRHAGRALVSMDGDLAPMGAIVEAAERHDAWTLADDAHGLGVVTSHTPVPLEMGTLSKALGSQGGYVCGSRAVIDLLKSRARSFVYTTGLAPASAAAALAALRIVSSEPWRAERVLSLTQDLAARLGAPAATSAIVPYVVGPARTATELAARLEARGFLVVAIRPPTVPEGTARLRFCLSAAHMPDQVQALGDAVLELVSARAA